MGETTIENKFYLAFENRETRCWETAETYLEKRQQGLGKWKPSLVNVGLSLQVYGQEWVLDQRSVGLYPKLLPQLEECSTRLCMGQKALIRTAMDDEAIGIYFLFEPKSTKVMISLLNIYDEDIYTLYPVPDPSPTAAKLYAYITDNKELLLSEVSPYVYQFSRVPFPKTELIEALDREAAIGHQIMALPEFANYMG